MNAPFVPEIATVALARSAYRPSRRSSPVALILSAAMVGGLLSSFLFMNVVMVKKVKREPLVVNMMSLPSAPPEAEERPPEPQQVVPQQPQIVAPLPEVTIPSPAAPPIVAAPLPPVTEQAQAAPSAPAPAPVRSGPAEAGDLTGNLLVANPPTYPRESRRLREQGTVVLSVLLSPAGTVDDISVAKSSGYFRLDHAALKAVRHWKWSPFRRGGEQIAVRGQVAIPFVIQA
jgi:protein TonB